MFIDHFDDASIGLHQHVGNGAIYEPAGTLLNISCPEGNYASFQTGDNSAPIAYKAAGPPLPNQTINGPWRFDLQFDNYVYTYNRTIAGLLMWGGGTDDGYAYDIGYYPYEGKILIHRWLGDWGSSTRLAEWSASVPNGSTVKHIYRVYINPLNMRVWLPEMGQTIYVDPHQVGFAYSTDEGANWSWGHQRDYEFAIEWIGPYCRAWDPGAGRTHDAYFDYFSIQAYDWSANDWYVPSIPDGNYSTGEDPRTFVGMEEESRFMDVGGPEDFYGIVSRGANPTAPQMPGQEQDRNPITVLEEEYRMWDPQSAQFSPGAIQESSQGGRPPTVGAEDHLSFTGGGEPFFSALDFEGRSGALIDGSIGRQKIGLEDQLLWELDEADYMIDKDDADGQEFLSDQDVDVSLKIPHDTSQFGFDNPTSHNHWGAARNGKYYADGVECTTEGFDFGSLANGLKDSAWSFPTRPINREPYYHTTPSWFSLTVSDDDEITVVLDSPPANWNPLITSWSKWVIDGDFDIQVEFDITTWTHSSNRFDLGVGTDREGTPAATQVYVYVRNNNTYEAYRAVNGSYVSLGSTTPNDLVGRLRITRISGVFQCYKWDGVSSWDTVGTTFSDASLSGPVYVWMGPWCYSGQGITVKINGFAINSGTVLNTASWAREATGDHRGTQSDMPTDLVAIATKSSLELIDRSANRLWMRFLQASNNLLFETTDNLRVRDLKWHDGILFAAMSKDTSHDEGGLFWIDFTTDVVRVFRESISSLTGGFYQDWLMHEPGPIVDRNSARGYANDNNTWGTPDYRTWSTAIFADSGYLYIVVGTQYGIRIFRFKRWEFTGVESGVNDDDWGSVYVSSTENTRFLWCDFDADGTFYYLTNSDSGGDAVIYSRDRTNGTPDGWEDGIPSGSFTAENSKILPGNRALELQYRALLYRPAATQYIFVPADEGVYRIEWPSGSWELFYGSGGTHDILPTYTRITSIAISNDGTDDLMVVGIETNERSQIALVKISTNTLYGVSVPESPTRAPKMVTA